MVKLFSKDRIKFFIILLVLSILCLLFLSGKRDESVDLISTITSSNYICLILNNIYIYYIYTRTKKVKSIYDKIIVRVGQDKFFNSYVLNITVDILIYFLILLIPIYIKFGINMSFINIMIVYLVLNFSNFFIQEIISMLIFLIPKGNKFIVIPVFMNFGFHYFLIPFFIEKIIGM